MPVEDCEDIIAIDRFSTFINGERLGPEGLKSDPYKLKSDDILACIPSLVALKPFLINLVRNSA
jgi:hypothetical protein